MPDAPAATFKLPAHDEYYSEMTTCNRGLVLD